MKLGNSIKELNRKK